MAEWYEVECRFHVLAESEGEAVQNAAIATEWYDRETGKVTMSGIGLPEGSVTVRKVEGRV